MYHKNCCIHVPSVQDLQLPLNSYLFYWTHLQDPVLIKTKKVSVNLLSSTQVLYFQCVWVQINTVVIWNHTYTFWLALLIAIFFLKLVGYPNIAKLNIPEVGVAEWVCWSASAFSTATSAAERATKTTTSLALGGTNFVYPKFNS